VTVVDPKASDRGPLDQLSPAKRALAQHRFEGRVATGPPAAVPSLTPEGPARLSLAQEQLWFFSQLAPGNPVYNESVSIHKDGPFDHEAFVRAFNEIVRRHEAWRTTFVMLDGEPIQRVGEPPVIELPILDLSGRPREDAEEEGATLAAADAIVPYDLAAGPLIRPRLVRFADDHHRLYLGLHHLVFDGFSLYRIVLPELVTLYEAYSAGRESPLPEPEVSYRDYSEWEREWMAGPAGAARLDYWREHLTDLPTLELPLDFPRPPVQRFVGRAEAFSVPSETVEALRSLASSLRVTFFQVLAACYAVLLHRYTGQEEVVFGTPNDLRQRPELRSVVGMSVTPVVLRCSLAGNPSFAETARRVSSAVLGAVSNVVPFVSVVRALQPERDPGLNSLFQAIMTLQPAMLSPDPAWSLHQSGDLGTSKFDLDLNFEGRYDGRLDGYLVLNSELFEAEAGRRIVGHLHTLFDSVIADPQQSIERLGLLTADETHRQLVEWNATDVEFGGPVTVHELVRRQAQASPAAIALEFEELAMSYGELEAAADAVAARLRSAGVRRGDVVALYCRRGLEAPIGMLGIMKAGAAYLPLDPRLPSARIALMVGDAATTVMLCEAALAGEVDKLGIGEVAVLPLDLADLGGHPVDGEDGEAASGDDLAYVLYTSGSSGTPKGVQVEHSGVVNMLLALAREPGMTADDTVLAVASFGFDAATSDLWLPLAVGARVVIAPASATADGSRLVELIDRAGVTSLTATPTTWQLLIEAGWAGSRDLVAGTAGEALNAGLAEAISSRSAQLWNIYGPTEATVTTSLDKVVPGERITIGHPIANAKMYVLDRTGEPVPVGVHGELYIGGAGVARGYLNRPQETAESFLDDPFHPGGRMYRTGDRVRRLADGRVQHLGRLDDQVKLRGYRIELGEIESALRPCPGVSAAAVVLIDSSSPADARLVAYVVPDGAMPLPSELRRRLRLSLPSYMVPSAFVELRELPRTPNGKLDHRRLPAPPAPGLAPGSGSSEGLDLSRTPLENQLLAVWSEVLSVENLGVDDDFFELGGHSLLAVRLFAEIEEALGMSLPLITMFERGATVRGMASAINALEDARRTLPSGARASSGAVPPCVFAILPHEASVFALRHGNYSLDQGINVVPLFASRVGRRLSTSIDEIVNSLLEQIQSRSPGGPYFLAGWSLGGIVAYEVAGRLRAGGQCVAWLGVIDAPVPRRDSLAWRAARLRAHGPKRGRALARYLRYRITMARRRLYIPGGIYDAEGASRALLAHSLSGNDVPLDLFLTARTIEFLGPTAGWADVHHGTLRVHRLPGDHKSLFGPSYAETIAGSLASSIAQAVADQTERAR
jgi:amino acid adenylation domain-containing protein